jgi:ankyrin repeat protein
MKFVFMLSLLLVCAACGDDKHEEAPATKGTGSSPGKSDGRNDRAKIQPGPSPAPPTPVENKPPIKTPVELKADYKKNWNKWVTSQKWPIQASIKTAILSDVFSSDESANEACNPIPNNATEVQGRLFAQCMMAEQNGVRLFLQSIISNPSFLKERDDSIQNIFHWLAQKDHTNIVLSLIRANLSQQANEIDWFRRSPIFFAHSYGMFAALNLTNSILSKDVNGRTPLHLLASQGASEGVLSIVLQSCRRGALGNLKDQFVSNVINERDVFRRTALHYAIKSGDPDTIEALLSCPSTQLKVRDIFGDAPIDIAVQCGNKSVYETLLRAGVRSLRPLQSQPSSACLDTITLVR